MPCSNQDVKYSSVSFYLDENYLFSLLFFHSELKKKYLVAISRVFAKSFCIFIFVFVSIRRIKDMCTITIFVL